MKDLFKNTVTILTFIGTNKVLYLFLTILLARKLGVEGVGSYSFVLAFTGLFFIFVRTGIGVAVRELASDTRKVLWYFWNMLLLMLVTGLISFILAAITIHFYPVSAEIKKAIYLYGFCLFFMILSGSAKIVFYALKRFKVYAATEIVADVTAVSAAAIFVLLGKGLLGVITGFIIGEAASATLSLIILWKRFINFPGQFRLDLALWKRLIGKGFYFIMQDLLRLGMFRVDIMVLSLFGGLFLTGIYQAACKISSGISIVPKAIQTVMYPEYAAKFIHSPKLLKRDYRMITLYHLIIAVSLYGLLILFSNLLVHYIYGPEFSAAVPLIKIFALATTISMLNMNNFIFLNATRREKLNSYLTFFIFLLNAVLDLLLVQKYGIKGVAIVSVFCAFTYFAISTILIFKKLKRVSEPQTIVGYGAFD